MKKNQTPMSKREKQRREAASALRKRYFDMRRA
jgi:hypothetical protein